MFTFLFGIAVGYSASYVRNRFGVGIKMKIQKIEKDFDQRLQK